MFLKFKRAIAKAKFSSGIDLGTHSIKALRLKLLSSGRGNLPAPQASGEAAGLCWFALEPAQPDTAAVLKKIKQAQGPAMDNPNIALCGPSTVIRYINFPKMSKDELKQALKFEAQKHIPFALAEVNLDSCILRSDLPDNKMLVMVAVAKKDFVKERLKVIEDAGLKVGMLSMDSVALANAFNFNYADEEGARNKSLALLNIGASYTNLNILESGIPRLSRDIHIAGNNFTQKIMDIFALDFKAAESLKISPDSQRQEKVKAGVDSVLSGLATEIRTSFDYYESQTTASVARIYLSGAGSLFPGLKDMLANLVGIEVEYWDPLKKISIAGNLDSAQLKAASAQLAVAVGLALF